MASEPLVESVVCQGRWVKITTYHDGPRSPQTAHLIFRTVDDAMEFVRVVSEAKRPPRTA